MEDMKLWQQEMWKFGIYEMWKIRNEEYMKCGKYEMRNI